MLSPPFCQGEGRFTCSCARTTENHGATLYPRRENGNTKETPQRIIAMTSPSSIYLIPQPGEAEALLQEIRIEIEMIAISAKVTDEQPMVSFTIPNEE